MSTEYAGEVELDPRRRLTLGKIGNQDHHRYRVDEDKVSGVLTLTPVVSVPVTLVSDSLRTAIEQMNAGQSVPRPTKSR